MGGLDQRTFISQSYKHLKKSNKKISQLKLEFWFANLKINCPYIIMK